MRHQPDRPVVLVLARYYVPAFKAGGPVRSLRNIVAALHEEFDFRILTSDRDHTDSEPFPDVSRNRWEKRDEASVFYADSAHRGALAFERVIRDVAPDIVYLNSCFSPAFSITPLALRRLGRLGNQSAWVVAPRGELSRGAMSLKAWKKRPALRLAKAFGIFDSVVWQATSSEEAEEIHREIGPPSSRVLLASNITEGVCDLAEPAAAESPARPLKVCFVSRVSRKKNLAFAMEAMARARSPVEFDIYGPVEDESLVAECRRIAAAAANWLVVRWHGHVPHEQVREIFGQHDLFLFPTLGENFGHVIFESLAVGTPVLVSDRTPWHDLEAKGAGWVRSLGRIQDFVDVIDGCASMPPSERLAMRRRAHAYAKAAHLASPAVEQTRQLLLGSVSSL